MCGFFSARDGSGRRRLACAVPFPQGPGRAEIAPGARYALGIPPPRPPRRALQLPRVPEIMPYHVEGWAERDDRTGIGEREIDRERRVLLPERLAALAAELASADQTAKRKTRRANDQ